MPPAPGKLRSQSQGATQSVTLAQRRLDKAYRVVPDERRLLRTRIRLVLHDAREHLRGATHYAINRLCGFLPAKADAAKASALIATNPLSGDSGNARKALFPTHEIPRRHWTRAAATVADAGRSPA